MEERSLIVVVLASSAHRLNFLSFHLCLRIRMELLTCSLTQNIWQGRRAEKGANVDYLQRENCTPVFDVLISSVGTKRTDWWWTVVAGVIMVMHFHSASRVEANGLKLGECFSAASKQITLRCKRNAAGFNCSLTPLHCGDRKVFRCLSLSSGNNSIISDGRPEKGTGRGSRRERERLWIWFCGKILVITCSRVFFVRFGSMAARCILFDEGERNNDRWTCN